MNVMTRNTRTFALSLTVLAALASGCANMSETQKSTAIGAGVGALAGAAIGQGKGAAIGAGVGALGGYVWSTQMQKKKTDMEQATAGTGVAVTQTADNQLKLSIPSDISFDTGRSDIKSNLQPILNQFAQGLNNQPNTEVRIVGHTDSTGSDAINNPLSVNRAASARDYLVSRGVDSRRVSIDGRGSREPIAHNATDSTGSDAINNPLSVNRAASARDYLVSRGVDSRRVSIDGRGSREPIADNATDAGRAKNRRIEIFLAERAPG